MIVFHVDFDVDSLYYDLWPVSYSVDQRPGQPAQGHRVLPDIMWTVDSRVLQTAETTSQHVYRNKVWRTCFLVFRTNYKELTHSLPTELRYIPTSSTFKRTIF